MSENNLKNAAFLESGPDILSSSRASVLPDDKGITDLLKAASSASFTPPIPGAGGNSIQYNINLPHPDWGSGYNPNPKANKNGDVFGFNFTSLTIGGLTPLVSTLIAAATNGIDLFANSEDPDSARIVINDPGNGSSLLIGDGLNLFVGDTMLDLLSKNGLGDSSTLALLSSNYPKAMSNMQNFKNGSGHMIVWNKTGVIVSASNNNASMEVGAGNKLYVGGVNTPDKDNWGTGNLQLGFNESSAVGKAAMILDEGSYLSVNGYLGGTADKSNAGASLEQGMANRRTGAVATRDRVKMDVEGDWGMIGDPRSNIAVNKTQVGNNNSIFVGGNMGVYMRTSMTVGSNTSFTIGSQGWGHTGSGLFVGSGGYMSTGNMDMFNIYGGMGAGFTIVDGNKETATLLLGDDNTVHLTDKAVAILGAEAGATISAGKNFSMTGAEISVGYGENKYNRVLITDPTRNTSAKFYIGDNANISLGYGSMSTNKDTLVVAQDGVIVLDAKNSILQIGANATINANLLSVGNYLRNSDTSAFYDSSGQPLGQYFAGSNNSVVIGSGANISLGKGLVVDETNGSVELQGSGKLIAGAIHMGRYYQGNLAVPMSNGSAVVLSSGHYAGGSNYIYTDASAGHVTIGDGYVINVMDENGTTGGIVIDGNSDVLMIGNQATVSANSLYLGDYKTDDKPGLPPGAYVTSGATISIGRNATVQVDGEMDLNGVGNSFTMLDFATLKAGKIVLDKGPSGKGSSNILSFGSNTHIEVDSGIIDDIEKGQFTLGNNGVVNVSHGDFVMGAATNNIFSMGQNGSITLNSGNLRLENKVQSVTMGDKAYIYAGLLSMIGDNQVFSVGNNADITFRNGIEANSFQGRFSIGSGASLHAGHITINGDNTNFTLSNGVYGNAGKLALGGKGITLNIAADSSKSLVFNGMALGSNNTVTLNGYITNGTTGTLTVDKGTIVTINGSYWANGFTENSATVNIMSNTVASLGDMVISQDSVFSVGDNAKFYGKTVNYSFSKNSQIKLGKNISYNIAKDWTFHNNTGVNKTLVLGDGASGRFGGISFDGPMVFDTGNANNLSFDTVSLNNSDVLNGNGKYNIDKLVVNSDGGTATKNSVFNAKGSFNIQTLDMNKGGTVNIAPNIQDATIGELMLGTGGTVSVGAGSTLKINSLSMDGTVPGTIDVGAGATLNIGTIATMNVGTDMPKIIIHNGAHIIVSGQDILKASSPNDHIVDFNDESNGIYEYDGDISNINGHIRIENFQLSDEIVFNNNTGSTNAKLFYTHYKDGVLSVYYNKDGKSETLLASFAYNPAKSSDPAPNVNIVTDPNGKSHIVLTKCFVEGTHIMTVRGEVTVESLAVGDEVVTVENGQRRNRKIIWLGSMEVHADAQQNRSDLYPVRIKAHAFGLNKPYRDLLLTPEHTVYVDGGLIPVRMLVNGRSILIDKTMDRFKVYHVETEQHSILLSENLMTESYLDTDNRHLFEENVHSLHLEFNEHADHKSWEKDAAAPLTVARERVEPVWHRLDRRAAQLGYKPVIRRGVTRNPNLCLVTQGGERLAPLEIKGNVYSFYVSATTRIVALYSRSAQPAETVGPFLDDRRELGVLVAKISVIADKTLTILPSDMADLSGWHGIEMNRTDRWTKGLAQLPDALMEFSNKDKLIKIELTDTAFYFVDDHHDEMTKLA